MVNFVLNRPFRTFGNIWNYGGKEKIGKRIYKRKKVTIEVV